MGLFKYISRLFIKARRPVESADQSGRPSSRFKMAGKKRDRQRPAGLSWQMHGNNPTRETTIVIGFDLGTSCTKIVVQDTVLKKASAVSFDELGGVKNPYLLSTKISIDDDGNFSLDREGASIDALKIKFLKGPDELIGPFNGLSLTAVEAVSAYIGLSLQEVKAWFWKEKLSDYKEVNIDWQLNIGMSSRSYDDHTLRYQMQRVALAGWNLSLTKSDQINISDVKRAVDTASYQLSENSFDEQVHQLHPDNVCPIPEIIAQVIGFARSPMRQDGMYLMVDVGASTMDVSNFIIHKHDDEDSYTILVSEVEKLGVSILHNFRIINAEETIEEYCGPDKASKFRREALSTIHLACDGIEPPPKIEAYFPALPKAALKKISEFDDEFTMVCSRIVRKVIKESMFTKNPYSTAWQNGLPVFLCGGGSKLSTYKKIIRIAQERMASTDFVGFDLKQLPKPANLETMDIPARDFHRMSVAYGLSFPWIDIGEIIPPRSIEDLVLNKQIRNIGEYFIDKDMI